MSESLRAAAPLGIQMLDTRFPRIVGDIGNAASFDFPVIFRRMDGIGSADAVTAHPDRPRVLAALRANAEALALLHHAERGKHQRALLRGRGHRDHVVQAAAPAQAAPVLLSEVLYDAAGSDNGEVFVELQKFDPHATPALLEELRHTFADYPGARIIVESYRNGPPINAPIEIAIVGPDLDQLQRLANEAEAQMLAKQAQESSRDAAAKLALLEARTVAQLAVVLDREVHRLAKKAGEEDDDILGITRA